MSMRTSGEFGPGRAEGFNFDELPAVSKKGGPQGGSPVDSASKPPDHSTGGVGGAFQKLGVLLLGAICGPGIPLAMQKIREGRESREAEGGGGDKKSVGDVFKNIAAAPGKALAALKGLLLGNKDAAGESAKVGQGADNSDTDYESEDFGGAVGLEGLSNESEGEGAIQNESIRTVKLPNDVSANFRNGINDALDEMLDKSVLRDPTYSGIIDAAKQQLIKKGVVKEDATPREVFECIARGNDKGAGDALRAKMKATYADENLSATKAALEFLDALGTDKLTKEHLDNLQQLIDANIPSEAKKLLEEALSHVAH